MGVAAYNRGSQCIADGISRDYPQQDIAFALMDRINNLPKLGKHPSAPFLDRLAIKKVQNVWWLLDPDKMFEGFGYWYTSLSQLVQSWDIYLNGYDETTDTWYACTITGETE